MRRSYKFRIYPKKQATAALEQLLFVHWRLYNEGLGMVQMAWDTCQGRVSEFDLKRWFGHLRKVDSWFSQALVTSGRITLKRATDAYKTFFSLYRKDKSHRPPRFKAREMFNSVAFVAGGGVRLDDRRIEVNTDARTRNGQWVSMRLKRHRQVEGVIKQVGIKREGSKWYAVLSCDLGNRSVASKSPEPAVGVDVGLTHFLTTSDGEHIENPRHYQQAQQELRRASRALSRKKRGSRRHRLAVRQLQTIHARVRDQRRHHHCTVAKHLAERYGLLAVEDLNVKGMAKGRLAKSVTDAGWSQFMTILGDHCESNGATFVKVDPRNTSQLCSGCGALVPKGLGERTHRCPHCGLVLDRDVNAARNILARGQVRVEPAACKREVAPASPKSPRETAGIPGDNAA